jgi:thiamine kinase-like enzyme
MLRKENELLVLRTKLNILYTVHNAVISLSTIDQNEKTFEQKKQLIELYQKQTKNKVNIFCEYSDFLVKIKSSIINFENTIEKLNNEVRSKGEEEIINSFDVVAGVATALQLPLNIQTISVAEFLSYERLAIKKNKNGKE